MLVKYIGSRKVRIDTVYGTHAIFNGHGDVLPVDNEKGRRMCDGAPTMYAEVLPTDEIPAVVNPKITGGTSGLMTRTVTEATGETVALIDASRAALAKYADEELGLKILDGHTKQDILNFISMYDDIAARAQAAGAAPPPPPPPPETAAAGEPEPEGLEYLELQAAAAEAKNETAPAEDTGTEGLNPDNPF